MKKIQKTCVGVLFLSLCHCQNTTLSTSRIESIPVAYKDYLTTNQGKIYYALRRSEFTVQIPFVVIRDVPYLVSDPTKPGEIAPDVASRYWLAFDTRPEKKATVTASFQADPKLMFAVATEESESAWTNTKELKIALDDKSMLTSVNGDFEDKKGEVIKNILTTAITVAKFSSGMVLKSEGKIVYKPKLLEKHSYFMNVTVTAEQFKSVARTIGSDMESTLDLTEAKNDVLSSAGRAIRQDSAEGSTDAIVLFQQASAGGVKLKLKLPGSTPPSSAAISRDLKSLENARGALDGVVVQKVRTGNLILLLGDEEVARGEVSLSDFAGPTVIPIQGKSFANNKRTITFNNNGGLKEYTATSTSQAEAVSSLVASESTALMKSSQEIEASKEAEVKLLATRAVAIQGIDLEILKKKNEIEATARQLVNATEETTPKKSDLEDLLEVKNLELTNLEEKRRLTSMGAL